MSKYLTGKIERIRSILFYLPKLAAVEEMPHGSNVQQLPIGCI